MRLRLRWIFCALFSLRQGLADADFESVKTKLDRSYSDTDNQRPGKYFHESTFHAHYDGRFAKDVLVYDERRDRLSYLLQTFLRTMNDIGVETWLMHGSLLGWWWNHKIMPWDTDVDVMISENSMHHLARFYNMSVHRHHLPNLWDPRQYLLEINPNYHDNKLDVDNMIDARWIDTDIGLYIDITTLRRDRNAQKLGNDGAMMAKDKHTYKYDDIFPLRETTFEGIPARVPFAYADLLIEEYGEEALSHVSFENHQYDMKREEWIPNAASKASSTELR